MFVVVYFDSYNLIPYGILIFFNSLHILLRKLPQFSIGYFRVQGEENFLQFNDDEIDISVTTVILAIVL